MILFKKCIIHFADAFENAQFLCDQYYMTSPDVEYECHCRKSLFIVVTSLDTISFGYLFSYTYNCIQ